MTVTIHSVDLHGRRFPHKSYTQDKASAIFDEVLIDPLCLSYLGNKDMI